MSWLETRIANNLQDRQVILEAIDLELGEVGHLARIVIVQTLEQLVKRTPAVLHLVVNVLGVEAQERAFKPLILFCLKVVVGKPELVERIFEIDNLLHERKLRLLEAEQLLLAIQLLEFEFKVLDHFVHFVQRVDVSCCVRNFSILNISRDKNINKTHFSKSLSKQKFKIKSKLF